MQTVQTQKEAGEAAAGALIISAIVLGPAIFPPLSLAWSAGFLAHDVWGWHPLFSILLGAAILLALAGAVAGLFIILPRLVISGLAAAYAGLMYYWGAHSPAMLTFALIYGDKQKFTGDWSLDNVWSTAIALLAAAIAAWATWAIKPGSAKAPVDFG